MGLKKEGLTKIRSLSRLSSRNGLKRADRQLRLHFQAVNLAKASVGIEEMSIGTFASHRVHLRTVVSSSHFTIICPLSDP